MNTLNRALKELRLFHRIKQIDLAKQLGISNTYLSEIEKGKKTPNIELLESYSKIFQISVSDILLFSEEFSPKSKILAYSRIKLLNLLEWISSKEIQSNEQEEISN